MYVGVDIGGTKTLIATLDENGVITEQLKFPTPHDYGQFITELRENAAKLETKSWQAGAVAAPGRIDIENGIAEDFGNLPWHDVPVKKDAEAIFGCPMGIENDANLAGLSEAMLHKDVSRVLYVTVSTGIGCGIIADGVIENGGIHHPEAGHMFFAHDGVITQWEKFASGKAIVERFGKRAEDIHDEATWQIIARDLSLGFTELIAITQPELIVIGGSVGTYFDRYASLLEAELKRFETPLAPVPPLIQAERPEQAVVYGCYDYAKYALAAA